MFKYMTSLEEINVTSLDTSKVTDMADIFTSLTSLEELDLSSFDLSKISSSYTDFLRNLTSLKRLKTPKVMPNKSITLSWTYVDENGNEYTALDQNTPTKTWLTKKQ